MLCTTTRTPTCSCIDVVVQSIEFLHTYLRRHRPLGNHTNRHDFKSRQDTWCRLKTDCNEQVVGYSESRAEQKNLRCPGAACQLSTRHRANCRILRSVNISNVIEVQKLHRLSVIRSGDEPVLVQDKVACCVEGQYDGLRAGRAIEANNGAVSVVELGVGSVYSDAVEDDARILELEDECGEWARALGDGGSLRDCSGFGWSLDGRGGVGSAYTRTGARIADCSRAR